MKVTYSLEILHEFVWIFVQAKEDEENFSKGNTDCGYFAHRWRTPRRRDFKHRSKNEQTDQRGLDISPPARQKVYTRCNDSSFKRPRILKCIRSGENRYKCNIKTDKNMRCDKNLRFRRENVIIFPF